MKKTGSSQIKGNEFSRTVFFAGMIGTEIILWFLMKKFILGYYFWQDKIHDGRLFNYIYIAVGVLNVWFVSERCRKRRLLRLITAGVTPLAAVMSLRWFFLGFITAKILLIIMAAYILFMLFRMIKVVLKKKKIRIIGEGMNNIFTVLTAVSMIGMTGYCLTGMDLTAAPLTGSVTSVAASDDGRSWNLNKDTLKLWKENIYTKLSDEEKKSLFQDTVDLECLYWGIDPVKLEVETYNSETIMGYYVDRYYVISIRKEMFDKPRDEVMNTLLHETHHAYVHKAVQSVDWDDREIEKNKELRVYKELQLYKQGIENYVLPEEDPDLYYNNPIEVAAREYAEEWTWKYIEYIDSI